MAEPFTTRLAELSRQRSAYVHATVVRAQRPTSAHAGDEAIVTGDGAIEGFVGGDCARESVRAVALDALRDGESVLLRVLPDGAPPYPEVPGARVVVNPCLSGGALEIFLQPVLPAPMIQVIGSTPIAGAVRACAEALGFEVLDADRDQHGRQVVAAIVSTLGGDEAATIRAALDVGTGFVGLVASRRRGQSVLDIVMPTEAERARIRTPVGIEIGARTPAEIALSIMAEVVRAIRVEDLLAPAAGGSSSDRAPVSVIDPICGMTVVVRPETPHLLRNGHDHWFCSPGCRARFADRSLDPRGDRDIALPVAG